MVLVSRRHGRLFRVLDTLGLLLACSLLAATAAEEAEPKRQLASLQQLAKKNGIQFEVTTNKDGEPPQEKSGTNMEEPGSTEVPSTAQPGGASPAPGGASPAPGAVSPNPTSDPKKKAIIGGIAAGAAASAVVGGVAIAIEQVYAQKKHPGSTTLPVGNTSKPSAAARQGPEGTGAAITGAPSASDIAAKVGGSSPTGKSSVTVTTTGGPGDEIPRWVWIILAVLLLCCLVALVAAVTAAMFRRSDRSSRGSSRRSARVRSTSSLDSDGTTQYTDTASSLPSSPSYDLVPVPPAPMTGSSPYVIEGVYYGEDYVVQQVYDPHASHHHHHTPRHGVHYGEDYAVQQVYDPYTAQHHHGRHAQASAPSYHHAHHDPYAPHHNAGAAYGVMPGYTQLSTGAPRYAAGV